MIEFLNSVPFLLLAVLLPLKMWASWEAARRDQIGWFVVFFLTWLYGIPEIVYLIWFKKSKW